MEKKIADLIIRVNAPEGSVFTVHDQDGNVVPNVITSFNTRHFIVAAKTSKAPNIFLDGVTFAIEYLLNQNPENDVQEKTPDGFSEWVVKSYFMLGRDNWFSNDQTDEQAYTTKELIDLYKKNAGAN
jgi:hypothetical protein